MGTTRIKVIDLSAEVEQIKTSRKHAQTASVGEIKKPLISEKKVKKLKVVTAEPQILEKIEEKEILPGKEEKVVKRKKITQRRSKRYQNAKLLIDPARFYPVDEALDLVKKVSIANFPGTVEAHIVVKQKGLRGTVTLPHPLKKETKILVFTSGKINLPKDGIVIGDETTIEEIEARKLVPKKDFNLVISTPEFMPKLAQLGKFLGPAGLMPNPKSQTVTEKPEEVIKKFSAGASEFKTESEAPVIHLAIGKLSQDKKQLKENFLSVIIAVNPQKIVKLYLAPTMGPSIKVDLSSLQ